MKKDTVTRPVQDLGVAAYILMHSHPLSGRKEKIFLFNIEKEKLKEFEDLKTSYLFSEFHYFDHCLMGLKKPQMVLKPRFTLTSLLLTGLTQ